jgi:hypothetical protein
LGLSIFLNETLRVVLGVSLRFVWLMRGFSVAAQLQRALRRLAVGMLVRDSKHSLPSGPFA